MSNKIFNEKARNGIRLFVIILLPLMILSAGLFLFIAKNRTAPQAPEAILPVESSEQTKTHLSVEPWVNPVNYIHRSETINGLKQEINILEINMDLPGVKVQPVLSFDLIYGFELLSEMAGRKNAYAAVTGGFFRDFGLPSGMVVIDGELISLSTGQYPVFIIENGRARLSEVNSILTVEYTGKTPQEEAGRADHAAASAGAADNASVDKPVAVSSAAGILEVDNINFPAKGKQTIVYTPAYGRSNRAEAANITATVENGIVVRIADYSREADIPRNGMLISFFDTKRYAGIELPIRVGDSVSLVHEPDMTGDVMAYECGCWLVRDGVSVVKDKDAWVGVLTNRDPRTAVGIKEDGTVLLITVDGRQAGYSAGFTGKELAEYLINCGARDAAMLDGGASTQMLLEGKLVSRPSHKGEERPLAGGILVLLERD
ncbi:MAG: phosphodiester glycosidase family protein [Clostridiaceae bacterium]|nr:phosphodiester glycosidase family protein [Clostridiaceae bacterium]